MKENNRNNTTTAQDVEQKPGIDPETNMMVTPDLQRPSKSNMTLSLLAMIIAVGAAGIGFWVWMKISNDITEVQNRVQIMNERIDDLNIKPSLSSLSDKLESEKSILSKKITEHQILLHSLQQSVAKLYVSTAHTPRGWTIAKALYLAELANYRIKFMRDVNAAIMALQGADNILEQSVDLSLSKARKAISEDLEKLNSVKLPNLNVIDEKLHHILKEHKYIPLVKPDTNKGEQIQLKETDYSPMNEGESESMLHALLQEINKHLVVKRHKTPVEPLPSEQTQIYYYHILHLKLESIRLALLKADNNDYQKQLNAALSWIDSHYTPSSAKPLKEELQQLIDINIAPPLPEVIESIDALKTVLDSEQKRRESE